MVNISNLSPGMRVKIVDEWDEYTGETETGEMDEYLGTIVTISSVLEFDVHIKEDNGAWYWNAYCIDYIVYDEYPDIEPADNDEVFSFLFA